MAQVYQFKVRVGVIVIKDGKLLLARQNNRPFWVFPGGTLDLGEGLEDCAIREIKEETNLDITIKKLIYMADFIQGDGKQTVDAFFLADSVAGKLEMETTENLNDLKFIDIDEVKALQVEPNLVTQRFLSDWRDKKLNTTTDSVYVGKYGV